MNGMVGIQIFNMLLLTSLTLLGIAQAAPSPVIVFGSYMSHQVNVDITGQNIAGDKGNEPTIAINPIEPGNIVIGWRRFNLASSDIKKGGYATSFDSGNSWQTDTLPSEPLESCTDPVLDVDSQGHFYYQSLCSNPSHGTSVFKSEDGGLTWSDPVYQFNGDKNWMAIDKTGGTSDGYIYSSWGRQGAKADARFFIRSIDGGASFQEPDAALPVAPFGFGRIAIGPQGDVYLSGIDETPKTVNPSLGMVRKGFYFLKSVNAKNSAVSPTFTAKQIDMGGDVLDLYSTTTPNYKGANGDVQIATDQSSGILRGNIYMMARVLPTGWTEGGDPHDIHFVRSSDGGETWSVPLRINDDPLSATSFQWFPMLSVAPNSRIDAVWYDTRNGNGVAPYRYSQLYYSYSWDGGETWSQNQAVTPSFNTHLPYLLVNGQEQQGDKLGDYTHMVSDANGAHIAYAATFNGEQDVYYLNVFPDCNNNKLSDVLDIQLRRVGDTNTNHTPDSCEAITVTGDLDGDRDVDQLDLNLLLAARNKPASGANDPKDLDKNGVINALDARKQALLCTRPRCAV